MQSFVKWFGQVPAGAVRVRDFEAREDAAPWMRRNLGRGIVRSFVIGYKLARQWWTVFFDRLELEGATDVELWRIEAYTWCGENRIDSYLYWPAEDRWRHTLYRENGEDYGRYRCE